MTHSRCLSSLTLLLVSTSCVLAQDAKPAKIETNPAKTEAKVVKSDAKAKPSIYNPSLDARDQVKQASAIAKRDNKRILVMFGGDWCGWCHKLHTLFQEDKAVRKVLNDEYLIVMVDTKAPSADKFLEECKGDLKQVGFPFLAVLDAEGTIVTRQKTDPLEEGDHHNPKKVLEFLAKWTPEKQDAGQVLSAALARASSEDKMLFVHLGAPWCGWCHKLEEFMARDEASKILGKDFVDVKIDVDRMTGVKELAAKHHFNLTGGIPWIALLDSKGKTIADSNGPQGNIGFPAAPSEIAHFMSMLQKTTRNISPTELATIEKLLKETPEAISAAKRLELKAN